MDRLLQDLRVSIRRLRRSPGFTFAAILTLALGIGANTTIFTAVNTLVFRPLPVERPKELVFLNNGTGEDAAPIQSYPNYLDLRDQNDVLAGLMAYRPVPVNFSQTGVGNARMWAYEVTGNYFDVLGVAALRGRLLHSEDDRDRRGNPVVVISYDYWQKQFGADPDVAGKKVKLNGLEYTIAGVAPQGFYGTETVYVPEAWVPMSMAQQIEPGSTWLDLRETGVVFVLGRLKPGVTKARAESALNAIAADLARQYPDANQGMKISLSAPGLFGNYFRGTVEAFAVVLMSLAGMVLLIACVNLAGLLLARASDRRKETAIRLALGASRSGLIRELLTESLLLSIVGGAAGLLLASWLTDFFSVWRPPVDFPVFPTLTIDYRVLTFAIVASLATGLLFGLVPALQSTRSSLDGALKSGTGGRRLRRVQMRDFLVGAQVALSVVLLVGSVLVVRSLRHALNLPLGFDPRHAASVAFDLGLQGYDEVRGREFQHRLIEKVRALPGISAAGLNSGLPLTLNINISGIYPEGRPAPKASEVIGASMYSASPGYLAAAKTRILEGRDFEERDVTGTKQVVLVNQTFARQIFPGQNPIGKRFRYEPAKGDWNEIVGVVEDGKYRTLGEDPTPAVFSALWQGGIQGNTLVARSDLPEHKTAAMLQRAVLELDPALPVYDAGSLTDRLGFALFPARVAAVVLIAFGALAVLLAATGVYGIMAYAVARRTREIGIRMALGATPARVLRVVLGRTAVILAIGTAAGLGLALLAEGFFSLVLYGVSATDPPTYGLVVAMMAVVAFAACWLPARRAIAVDPLTALRTE